MSQCLRRHSLSRYRVLLFAVLIAIASPGYARAAGLSDFTSDGCSLFPDGSLQDRTLWCDCCLEHDLAYWRGGAAEERKAADERLRDCVRERTGNAVLAKLMYDGVRAGGHPVFPTWYRWAYGWGYGRGYRPLTEQERRTVAEKTEDYWMRHPGGYCAKEKE